MDEPLDFEVEDLVLKSPAPAKRRKKVIGLDDLVSDFLQENKKKEMKLKRAKSRINYHSDEDDDRRVAKLSECVEKCEQEMGEIDGEDDIQLWGLQVFGDQKTQPPIISPPESCKLLQAFVDNELNSLVELDINKGGSFLESLLVNDWLLKLVYARTHVEKSIAAWTFNLMLYSSEEALSASAVDFWTAILSLKSNVGIEWLPNYSELISALEIFGFLLDKLSKPLPIIETESEDSCSWGPPSNIRAWIKFVSACVAARSTYSIFSASEVEELVVVITCLFLDRQLLGLTVILNECLVSTINFFTNDEWNISCKSIAKSLLSRVPRDINCLRALECIRGVDDRSKQLRHVVAYEMLVACLDNKATDPEEILRLLMAINVRDKKCDLFKMYIYLVLTENWLLSNPEMKDKSQIYELLGICLRNCSCQITSTDLRSYASKIRSKASYLLQSINSK